MGGEPPLVSSTIPKMTVAGTIDSPNRYVGAGGACSGGTMNAALVALINWRDLKSGVATNKKGFITNEISEYNTFRTTLNTYFT